jgi:hypothetical protein
MASIGQVINSTAIVFTHLALNIFRTLKQMKHVIQSDVGLDAGRLLLFFTFCFQQIPRTNNDTDDK